MSKKLSKSDLSALIAESIKNFKDYFSGLMQLASEKSLKRAQLVAYWIKEYVNYQLQEDTFKPKQLPRYERGNVVEVHFLGIA